MAVGQGDGHAAGVFQLLRDGIATSALEASDWYARVGVQVRHRRHARPPMGTITVRAAIANVGGTFEPGEYAFEYLRRLSRSVRVFAAIEGSEDEVELIGEAQVFLTPKIALKLNNAFGVTSKATDWAPEIGVMFVFN